MGENTLGQTDRVNLAVPIQVMETDIEGHQFVERTRTVVISRHGALIPLTRKLAPEQELVIRHLGSSHEAVFRVVGQIAAASDEYLYGVALLNPSVNFWGIDFAPLTESEKEASRILLSCTCCGQREATYLSEIEFEIFTANQEIARNCKRCGASTFWKRGSRHAGSKPGWPSAPSPRIRNLRRQIRARLGLTACLRLPGPDQEIVVCENVSRGGFCFRSRRRFLEKFRFEAAVPYSREYQNTFVPAQIVYCQELSEAGVFRYGVAYLKAHKDHLPRYRL